MPRRRRRPRNCWRKSAGRRAAGCRCGRQRRRPQPAAAAGRGGTGRAASGAGSEARRKSGPTRGGAHVGVMPLQLGRHIRGRIASRPGPGRRDHHGAGAVPLDLRRRVQFAGALRRRNRATRQRSGARSASTSCWMARSRGCATGCASRCACSTCGPAIRWSGRGGSIGSRTICCPCRTRSPPRSWRRSIRRSC